MSGFRVAGKNSQIWRAYREVQKFEMANVKGLDMVRGSGTVYLMPSSNSVYVKTVEKSTFNDVVELVNSGKPVPLPEVYKVVYGTDMKRGLTMFLRGDRKYVYDVMSRTFVRAGVPTFSSFVRAVFVDYLYVAQEYRNYKRVIDLLNVLRKGQGGINAKLDTVTSTLEEIKVLIESLMDAKRTLKSLEARLGEIESLLSVVKRMLEQDRVDEARSLIEATVREVKETREGVEEKARGEIPSFALDNPWLDVLSQTRRDGE